MTLRREHAVATGMVALVATAAAAIAMTVLPGGEGHGPVRLSSAPLGVNVAPWDGIYAGKGGDIIQPLLKAAGITQLRYGGGSYADFYNWQSNTDIGNCLPGNPTASFTSGCAKSNPLGFSRFSQRAREIGAESFVTVNYGSGTPATAADWVTTASRTPAKRVARWEVGNENYGCWEVNNKLAGPPANYRGYRPAMGSTAGQYQTCPMTTQGPVAGMKTLATSYADNALPFLRAMKKADPAARIGVPWAFANSVPGGSRTISRTWNDTVLRTDGPYVSFVDAHYYPFSFTGKTGGGNPSDGQVLRTLTTIGPLAAATKSDLAAHDPGAALVIGETGVSSGATTTVCTPVGGIFAAGVALSWLAAGAQSVNWWDLNNYGNTGSVCVNPDFGLFTSSARPVAETPYYGYLLASVLARPRALLATLGTSSPASVLAYQSALPSGKHAVAFLNLDTATPRRVRFHVPAGLGGVLKTWTYSAGKQNPANSEIVTGTTPASAITNGITLAPESITVLETTWP